LEFVGPARAPSVPRCRVAFGSRASPSAIDVGLSISAMPRLRPMMRGGAICREGPEADVSKAKEAHLSKRMATLLCRSRHCEAGHGLVAAAEIVSGGLPLASVGAVVLLDAGIHLSLVDGPGSSRGAMKICYAFLSRGGILGILSADRFARGPVRIRRGGCSHGNERQQSCCSETHLVHLHSSPNGMPQQDDCVWLFNDSTCQWA
jgi:hypothetical protein